MQNSSFNNTQYQGLSLLHKASLDPRQARKEMARDLYKKKGIRDMGVLRAMETVPRHLFVQEAFQAHAYHDTFLPIGYGQTISQPSTVAKMTELLEVGNGARVLEVGTGSGYQAAVLATMGCHVFSLERISELSRRTSRLLKSLGYINIQVHRSDGTLGFPQAAPYERIMVTAGGPKIPPPLLRQLSEGGIMLIPVGEKPREQQLVRIKKINGAIYTEYLDHVIFVNLVGDEGWRE